jgi:opacity protein-like surface antigen
MELKTATTTGLAALGICLLIAAPAFSQEASSDDSREPDYARNGIYVGLGAIGAHYVRVDQIESDLDADQGGGFSLVGGYRITPILAFEMEFEMLPKTDFDLGGGTIGDLSMWALTGNVKVFMWTGRFQPYALMGMGAMQGDSDDQTAIGLGGKESALAFRFGTGLDFYITEKIVATVGLRYVLPGGQDMEDFDYISYGGGIQYRF